MEALPPALADALQEGSLVAFCGAGVSKAPPSCLPDWQGFNSFVLDAARASALRVLPELDTETRDAVERLSLADVPNFAFSETLVRSFAGDTWFPVLSVLDGDAANANHLALAELARLRVLRAIVSTNFDTLIERAFRVRGVNLSVYERAEHYDVASPTCALYKIHGSAKDAGSLVDTVTQKLLGLSDDVRGVIAALAAEAHLLFLGFSGDDLLFSDDYLGLGGSLTHGCGVTWLFAPDRPVPPQVAAVVAAAGERGAIVRGLLPGYLTRLGIAVEEHEAVRVDAQERADERARATVSRWLEGSGIGPLSCAVYLARLLSLVGRSDDARNLRATVAKLVAEGSDRVRARSVLHALAVDALRDGDLAFADGYLRRELALAEPPPEQAEEVADEHRALAEAHLGLAICARRAGRLGDVAASLETAVEHAEAYGHADVVAAIEVEFAKLARDRDEHRDEALARLETARRYAASAGAAELLLEIELATADAYAELTEYDSALDALDRASRYARVSADFRGEVRRRALLAELALRRGDPDACASELEMLIGEAVERGDRLLSDRLRWRLAELLGFRSASRERVLGALDALLESTAAPRYGPVRELFRKLGQPEARGEIVDWAAGEAILTNVGEGRMLIELTGPRTGVPSRRALEQYRSDVVEGRVPSLPPFFDVNPEGEEARVRHAIAVYEYAAADPGAGVDAGQLPTMFVPLRGLYYNRGLPHRQLDVATAQLRAAERIDDRAAQADALESIGIAHDLAGEPARAVDAYRLALDADAAAGGGLRRSLLSNLALALGRIGSFEEAFRYFDEAIALHQAAGKSEEEARSRWNLATLLLRANEPERALATARSALEIVERLGNPAAVATVEETVALAELALDSEGGRPPAVPERPVLDGPPEEADPAVLGNLALAEWTAGEHAAARAHCAAAMAGYTTRGDRIGISRSLNNLAEFAASERDFDEAVALTRRALNLRMIAGDASGQLLTLANLAAYEYHREEFAAAVEAARRALLLAEGRLDERPAFGASRTLVLALAQLGDTAGAAAAARRCLELGTRQGAPELADLRELLEELAASTAPATPMPAERGDAFSAELAEATRLARLGDVDGATRVVEHARASYALGPKQLGELEGTRGNALQNAQRDTEAAEAFRRAAELLVEAGDDAQASNALQLRGVSLRRLGRLDEAEAALRDALPHAPAGGPRSTIEISLANTLLDRSMRENAPPALVQEARELVTHAAAEAGTVEERGVALVALSSAEALEGDIAAALQHRREGIGDLRRANSRQLEAAETGLRALEELAQERDAGSGEAPPAMGM